MPSNHDPESPSLGAHLLCAVPQLADPNFARAVVLMIEHDAGGAFGLVLNNPLPTTLAEVGEVIGLRWAGDPARSIRLGGPVEPVRGFVLHDRQNWDPNAEAIVDGLFLTVSLDGVDREREVGAEGSLQMFMGYAGWGPGQLEAEMNSGAWLPVPVRGAGEPGDGVDAAWVLEADASAMWAEALRSVGIDPARVVGHRGLGTSVAKA
ncbi:MAG TPA: YqgE/AlgH family protein [Nannocystaceae bacterium]|nr:YqgE/AlgH family protein [Nannocystaceae bacterium]